MFKEHINTQTMKIIFAVVLVLALWYVYRNKREGFTSYDTLDPQTLQKLKATVLTDKSRTSEIQVAYNDAGSYRPDRIRPFNDSQSRISEAQASNYFDFADQFDNSYFKLWMADELKEKKQVLERAEQIEKSKMDCLDYKNINQCMSVCSNTKDCTGFYIDSPGKCCMMRDPPFVPNRHSYNKSNNEIDMYGHRTLNALIRRAEQTDGKLVFDYVKNSVGGDTYSAPLTREGCKKLCPKCIMGRCPDNYRCTGMTADPRYNMSCMISNEGRYDENKNHLFDDKSIPYLDDKYGLNEYAGYDDSRHVITNVPETHKLDLHDHLVPSKEELKMAANKQPFKRNSSTGSDSTVISNPTKIYGNEGFSDVGLDSYKAESTYKLYEKYMQNQ